MLLTRGEILDMLDERIAKFESLMNIATTNAQWNDAYVGSEVLKAFRESIHKKEKNG